MKNLHRILLKAKFVFIVFFIIPVSRTHAQATYIQVVCEPEVSIFLEDSFIGKTTGEIGGLIIENVIPGSLTIKVVKEGFSPQIERINVKLGEVYKYSVKPFVPRIKITQTGNEGQQQIELKVGKLRIQSLPVSIKVSIPSLEISDSKTQDVWNADEIPVGDYDASFNWNNKTLHYTIKVVHNKITHLFVNMIKGEVEDRSQMFEDGSANNLQSSVASYPALKYGSVTDIDGNIYKTIQIGTQTWMDGNLKTTRYNDGTVIPNVTDNYAWEALTTPGFCWYNNEEVENKATYGALYNWFAVNTGKLCPIGWHVPTDTEWTNLTTYLGGKSVAGGKLKEACTNNWLTPNTGATNITGFKALPGGMRYFNGTYIYNGLYGFWWSSTEYTTTSAWDRDMGYRFANVYRDSYDLQDGFSVRCLRDN
jgi:uncharacterized protein (TIGR02145 family)